MKLFKYAVPIQVLDGYILQCVYYKYVGRGGVCQMVLGIYYGMFHVHADMVDSNNKLAIIRKPPPKAVRILYIQSIHWSMYQLISHVVQKHINTSGCH